MKRILAFSLRSAVILVTVILCSVQLMNAKLDHVLSSASEMPRDFGEVFVVTSSADSGPGTLRQALLDANSGDTITFDPTAFPPSAPVTISVTSQLPHISQGNLTVDASNAGVILDGSQAGGEWTPGIEIASEHNIIRGLRAVHFTGPGIQLHPTANFNTIGGNRKVGTGPLGQGNLFSDNADGVAIFGSTDNTILGNLIGTDVSGTGPFGNRTAGIFLEDSASRNNIGPNNIIAYNGDHGVDIRSESSVGNTITQNSIHDNVRAGIHLIESGIKLAPPLIFDFNLNVGTVSGTTCANCTVEIYSDNDDEGENYEGRTSTDSAGSFTFSKGSSLNGPHLTATATNAEGNTSAFSQPTSGESRSLIIQTGNNLPRSLLKTKRSTELEDNRIGDNAETEHISDWVWNMGLKWMRVIIDPYGLWQHVDWDHDGYAIDPREETVIDDLVRNNIRIMLVLDVWHEEYQVVSVDPIL